MIRRLCLIGVGLIGGSLSLALKEKGLVGTIVGFDTDFRNLSQALELGVIDLAADTADQAVAGADWVVIATPVGALGRVFAELQPHWRDDWTVTDTGSTKLDVVDAATRVFGGVPANFVPGHPIAGAELSGAGAARADLFERRRVILTPVERTDRSVLHKVEQCWLAIGALVSEMAPAHHDEVLAATSHLPHVLAFVLTEMLGRKDEQQEIFQYAAGGFRDFTRIASSDPRMWLDICLANRQQLLPLLEEYREALRIAGQLIQSEKAEELLALFSDARNARQRFLDQLEK